jgi:hypothetical protein
MPMIDEPPWPFLMTPAQHLQWARILRRKGLLEKAQRQEQLARAIEIIECRPTSTAREASTFLLRARRERQRRPPRRQAAR